MRDSENRRRSDPPADSESTVNKLDPGTQNGLDGLLRSLGGVESALSAVRERVGRLETDVRNLQSQNANRA